jgi:hypothetical protein
VKPKRSTTRLRSKFYLRVSRRTASADPKGLDPKDSSENRIDRLILIADKFELLPHCNSIHGQMAFKPSENYIEPMINRMGGDRPGTLFRLRSVPQPEVESCLMVDGDGALKPLD